MTRTDTISVAIDSCIHKGLNYLQEHQLPNGEFCSYYSPDDAMQEWCVPDSTVFITTVIAEALLPLRELPVVQNIHKKIIPFLHYQVMNGGVWNYFAKWNLMFRYTPADIDTTVVADHVLKILGASTPENRDTLLANQNKAGLFYTWFISRPVLRPAMRHLKVALREFKYPLQSFLFWLKNEAGRNDIDGVVNANVLYYFNHEESRDPIINYLLKILYDKKEGDCDKWYRNPFVVYYSISRNYKQNAVLEPAKQLIIDRIYLQFNDGRFGNSSLDTALAISALLNFNHLDNKLDSAVQHLISIQQAAGNWERNIFFYSGPSKAIGWGSEELTTAFCIEALHKRKSTNSSFV